MKDLRGYLDQLRRHRPQDLVHVREPVSGDREPVALLHRLEAQGQSPALLFERIGDSAIPMVTNIHGTRARLALALGVEGAELGSAYQSRLQRPIDPVIVKNGPVQEVIKIGKDVDVRELPLVRPWDNCVAYYIGGGILVAKDPQTGIRNLSYNRLMFRAPNRFTFHAAPGLHLAAILRKSDAHGQDLPVAIILGVHPALAMGTLAKVPFGVDEFTCAGGMLGEPVRLVACKTVPMEVPADAEIVLEGRVLHGVREPEGPYGEFTGYAMPQEMQLVLEITAITRRRDAMHQDVFGGGREHLLMGAVPKESTLEARMREKHPAVRKLRLPLSGCGRLHAYVALGEHEPGEPRRVIESLFAMDHFLKNVWVVDADVNIHDDALMLWAMGTCFQPARDTLVLDKVQGSSLDPSASSGGGGGGVGSKAGYDCTRKRRDFPPRNYLDPAVVAKMDPRKYLGRD